MGDLYSVIVEIYPYNRDELVQFNAGKQLVEFLDELIANERAYCELDRGANTFNFDLTEFRSFKLLDELALMVSNCGLYYWEDTVSTSQTGYALRRFFFPGGMSIGFTCGTEGVVVLEGLPFGVLAALDNPIERVQAYYDFGCKSVEEIAALTPLELLRFKSLLGAFFEHANPQVPVTTF